MTRYRIPERLAHVVPEKRGRLPRTVYLMPLPDGDPVALQDSAAWIWLFAADGEADIAEAVAELVGQPPGEVRAEVEGYLAQLVGRGLLQERG